MSANQSVFTFELNETLYFDKGQEVAELRGISLDPEISIQAFNDYISIRGVLELQGAYEKAEDTVGKEESVADFSGLDTKRYVENVVETDDSLAEFTHRFPVEISVPTYRVSDIDDVAVSVESFDYELPEQSQLKLYSTIAIHGINQDAEVPRGEEDTVEEVEQANQTEQTEQEEDIEQAQEPILSETVEEVEQDETEAPSLLNREADSFEFEIKQNQQEDVNQTDDLLSIPETPSLSEELAESEEDKVEEKEEGRWSFKTKSQSFSDFFAKEEVKSEEMEELDEIVDSEDNIEPKGMHTEIVYDNTSDERDDEDITYLSDIFRDSEEEGYTKMRLCIVQKDDTIETISERFQVSPLQIIKQNQLEEDFDVSEGQLLYIPAKKNNTP
ncbi:stage VI sporulation protein D [Oceanobacillus salinisoli]|uniref:stage VI sporulation protein D n=1 Tax=Oceanobacillus salinisoli TaxID=2678611 RepID=UPI0012E153AB|nr:stage VI sporulation protein D [Oceanobacillus salinisoli]